MEEWIKHYLSEGVDHFYMINNNSNDNYMHVIETYKNYISSFHDDRYYCQEELYNTHFMPIKYQTEWIMVVDLDEFVYARKQYKTISEYLRSLTEDISMVCVPWKMFSSGNFIEQPKSVLNSIVSKNYDYINLYLKSIMRTNSLLRIGIHSSEVNNKKIFSNGTICEYHDTMPLEVSKEMNPEDHLLHLNHYPIQSYNWFKSIKMTRGDCVRVNNVRNKDYFIIYNDSLDINLEIKDKTFLKNILFLYTSGRYSHNVSKKVFRSLNENTLQVSSSYNLLFGDIDPGMPKYLKIYHPEILMPVVIDEDHQFIISNAPHVFSEIHIICEEDIYNILKTNLDNLRLASVSKIHVSSKSDIPGKLRNLAEENNLILCINASSNLNDTLIDYMITLWEENVKILQFFPSFGEIRFSKEHDIYWIRGSVVNIEISHKILYHKTV